MKKFLIFLLAVLVVSCTNTPQEQTVRFHTNLIESGELTRSSDYGEIISLIESTYPSINPKIWYSDEEKVPITLNQEMTVKVGTWLVAWDNPGITVMTEVMGTAYFALQPYMDISTNVTITPGVTDYTLPVNYNSIAFVWDSREVSNVYHNGNNGNLPQYKSGFGVNGEHYGVFFLNGGWDSDESILILQVRPQEGMGKVTNFYFSNYYDEWQGHTYYKLTRGHFFVLHPESITEVDGTTFSTSFEDWICDLD